MSAPPSGPREVSFPRSMARCREPRSQYSSSIHVSMPSSSCAGEQQLQRRAPHVQREDLTPGGNPTVLRYKAGTQWVHTSRARAIHANASLSLPCQDDSRHTRDDVCLALAQLHCHAAQSTTRLRTFSRVMPLPRTSAYSTSSGSPRASSTSSRTGCPSSGTNPAAGTPTCFTMGNHTVMRATLHRKGCHSGKKRVPVRAVSECRVGSSAGPGDTSQQT